MSDIVERLRGNPIRAARYAREAADEIERQRALFDKWHTIAAEKHAEIKRLRSALRYCADGSQVYSLAQRIDIARRALEEK